MVLMPGGPATPTLGGSAMDPVGGPEDVPLRLTTLIPVPPNPFAPDVPSTPFTQPAVASVPLVPLVPPPAWTSTFSAVSRICESVPPCSVEPPNAHDDRISRSGNHWNHRTCVGSVSTPRPGKLVIWDLSTITGLKNAKGQTSWLLSG